MDVAQALWGRLRWRRGQQGRGVELSAAALERQLASGATIELLDIRDAAAFEEGHLPGARHVPLGRLAQEAASLDPAAPTVVY